MKTSEARNTIHKLLDVGLINHNEATFAQRRISDVNTGRLYGSTLSWQLQAKLRANIVEDLLETSDTMH